MEIELSLKNNDAVIERVYGESKVNLGIRHEYRQGDYFELILTSVPAFVAVQLDASLKPTVIYLDKSPWIYQIPIKHDGVESPYPDGAFSGVGHCASAKVIQAGEVPLNIAMNSHDQHEPSAAYPHVSANAETRNESVFYAKNAIDGILANLSHGPYPFASWGIDGRDDAALNIDFGRDVAVDSVGILLRADFPHDGYWHTATLKFSDGSVVELQLRKTAELQKFDFTERRITWVKLDNLKSAPNSGEFKALTQIEVYRVKNIN